MTLTPSETSKEQLPEDSFSKVEGLWNSAYATKNPDDITEYLMALAHYFDIFTLSMMTSSDTTNSEVAEKIQEEISKLLSSSDTDDEVNTSHTIEVIETAGLSPERIKHTFHGSMSTVFETAKKAALTLMQSSKSFQ